MHLYFLYFIQEMLSAMIFTQGNMMHIFAI